MVVCVVQVLRYKTGQAYIEHTDYFPVAPKPDWVNNLVIRPTRTLIHVTHSDFLTDELYNAIRASFNVIFNVCFFGCLYHMSDVCLFRTGTLRRMDLTVSQRSSFTSLTST